MSGTCLPPGWTRAMTPRYTPPPYTGGFTLNAAPNPPQPVRQNAAQGQQIPRAAPMTAERRAAILQRLQQVRQQQPQPQSQVARMHEFAQRHQEDNFNRMLERHLNDFGGLTADELRAQLEYINHHNLLQNQ
jgi:hypothetical protein